MGVVEKFVSSWNDGKTLPESYIFPPDQRPGEHLNPKSKYNVPLIDLTGSNGPNRAEVVRQIMNASQELGAFQVKNHDVPIKLMNDTRNVIKEFFSLPLEDKEKYVSHWDSKEKFTFFTSNYHYDEEKRHYWRDGVTQRCFPLEECTPYWPDKPTKYREIVGEFTTKAKELGLQLLDLIAEGLGLEKGYFANELTDDAMLNVNHYPACPDPTLTLGTGKHSDRSIITVLMQGDVAGLQFCKNGEWVAVDPVPDVFCINLGYIMQVVSNGKLISGDHRVVTNPEVDRESAALLICPTNDCHIEPAKALINADNPAVYRPLKYYEFLAAHNAGRKAKLDTDQILKPFEIKP